MLLMTLPLWAAMGENESDTESDESSGSEELLRKQLADVKAKLQRKMDKKKKKEATSMERVEVSNGGKPANEECLR